MGTLGRKIRLKEVKDIVVWKLICTFAARKVRVCTKETENQ